MEIELSRLIEALPGLVWTALPDGRAAAHNERWHEYTGLSADQARDGWRLVIHPDDLDRVLERWRAFLETGRPGEVEARLRRHDGAYRWMRVRGFPLRDARDEIIRWCALHTDIDDAKRAEATLAGEKRLLELVARGVPLSAALEAICRQVEDLSPGSFCSILLVDPAVERFRVGAGPSLPASYNTVLDGKAIDPTYGPCSVAAVLKVPSITAGVANDPRWSASIWPALMAEHGLDSCWSIPILAGGQEVLGVFAIYRREPVGPTPAERELIDRFTQIAGIALARELADTALKASEADLRRANRHLTEAQRLSHTGSFTWDVQADDHTWSEEIHRIFGFDSATKATLPMIQAAVHPEDLAEVASVIGGAFEGKDFDLVFRVVRPDGEVRHAHVVGHRFQHVAERPVFFGAIQDVTESKVAEDALIRARAELAHVARVTTLSALTASIAHEVNQPLAGIITNASTCLRMLAAEPPNLDGARATAQRTIRDGNRASEVIKRLRAMFVRKPPATEPVDLNDAAREVLALSASELQAARVVLRTDFAQDLPAISGDRVQLQQVILNLVLNAADAMSEVGGRTRDLWVTTGRDEAGRVTLCVRDCGVGLEPQSLEKLFDAFYTTKPQGMGVGLSISRSIIESHEGRLWASANQGPGATFAFSIPSASEPVFQAAPW